MRVISGIYRGRTLRTVRDLSVRPAADRVRQTIFDMLTNRMVFEGARVLDLFAGSGSLGIEALSRGAAHATFVENGHDAAEFIELNLRTLGCAESALVLETDALGFVRPGSGEFDLVFADPPYAFDRTGDIPAIVLGGGIVRPGGYLLIEHAGDVSFGNATGYRVGPVKRFGRTHVTFFTPTIGRKDGE
ncbi:MAG TPA: 16S rRNA (guanine(966)-N(2))-methyltransferase RsmD [Bacteroidota bacterium]